MDVCRVLNIEDNTTMTVASEWLDEKSITVTILREGMVPLYGQTSVDKQLREYPRPEVSREKALVEMREELSGKQQQQQANGTRFVLRGTRFSWKTKAWWKGGLDVRPVEDIATLADMSLRWLNERAKSSSNEKDERRKEEESLLLKKKNIELAEKLRTAEAAKKRMEQTLYSKFLLLLNEKKKIIRHLEEKLSKSKESGGEAAGGERSAPPDEPYNQTTDDESSSDHVPSSQPDLVIRPTRRDATALLTDDRTSKSRSDRSCSPESEQEEIVLKFEETPPDHPYSTEHHQDMLVAPSNNDQ